MSYSNHPQWTPTGPAGGPPTPPPQTGGPPPAGPPGRRSTGAWIVGGIVIVLVVLLGVGWTLYAVGVFDPGTSGGSNANSSKAGGSGESGKPPHYSIETSFEESCEAADLSEFEDILPEQDGPRTSGTPAASVAATGFSCTTSFTSGVKDDGSCEQCVAVSMEAAAFGDDGVEGARQWYETLSEGLGETDPHSEDYKDKVEVYEGDWEEGVFACAGITETQPDGSETERGICHGIVVDGNLLLEADLRVYTPKLPEHMEAEAMKAMLDDAVTSAKELFTAA